MTRRARDSSAVARVALSHLAVPSGRHRLAVAALLLAEISQATTDGHSLKGQ